jgi:hypothetical protein
MLIESSDADTLLAAAFNVALGAAQARQDERSPAVHEVTAVEFRADLDCRFGVAQRLELASVSGAAMRTVGIMTRVR